MDREERNSGIDLIGFVPWGTHFCQFYETPEDLTSILVPYFKAGLENNEYCLWVTAEPLGEQSATEALRKAMPDFNRYLEKGQIEVVPHDHWYLKDGVFDLQVVLGRWIDRLNWAQKHGYDGLRATGNTAWLDRDDWKSFTEYEEKVNSVIRSNQMMAICTYHLDRCGPAEVIDVVDNHQFALIRRQGQWQLMESPEHKQAEGKRQTILKTALDGFWIHDLEGRLLEVNDSYCKMIGYTQEELLTMSIPDIEAAESPEETARHIKKIVEQGYDRFETRHKRKDGKIIDIEISSNYIDVDGGQTFVFVRDITEHKQAEEALIRSEQNFRNSLDTSPLGIRIVTAEGETLYANRAILDIYGYDSIEELKTTPRKKSYTPESYAEHQVRKERRQRGEHVPSNYEISIVRKNGEIRHLEVFRKEVLWGGKLQFQVLYHDVTECKLVEEALKLQKAYFQQLFDNSPEGIVWLDEADRIVNVNAGFETLFGYQTEEIKGRCINEVIVPEDHLKEAAALSWATQHKDVMLQKETVRKRKDGSLVDVSALGYPIRFGDKTVGVYVIYRDITEHKRVEEALRESEENFHRSLDDSPLGIRIVTAEGETLYANRAILDIYGYGSIEELETTPREKRYTPESYAEHRIRRGKRKQGEYVPWEYEISIVRKDGEIRHLQVFRKEVLWDGKKQFQVLYHDITERKQAEDRLRKSETKYRTLVERLQEGVYQVDTEGKYITLNEAGAKILGFDSPDEVVGKCRTIDFYYDKKDRQKAIEELRKTGRFVTEIRAKRKDGSAVWTLVNNNATLDEHGNIAGYEGVFRDITEQKQLEEELRRIEKLESVGTLAGGIAHDFNNILTGIMGNITLAERHIEPKGKAAERLLEAKKASLRAKDLTQQLLTLARGGAPIKEVASVAELLEESAMFALRGSNVKCEFSLPADLWAIEIDKGQMSQVITNLVINADEAMPEGGILDIRVENTVIERKGVLPLPEGDYVKITVEDHGVGIPKKHLGRIFDPYFTTKQKGTGLGLATTHSIIKNHNGHITVESEPGVGTTFHIYLPASKKPVTEKEGVEEAAPAAFRGRKRILVMDDEEMIREMLSNTLSTAGFEVELASDGKEAIERYEKAREAGQPFGAVIMDLTIPGGMGGKEAIKRLIEIDPDVKAIVSSGYSTDPIMADFRKYGFSAVLTKPYSVGELERTLRRMLRGGKRST